MVASVVPDDARLPTELWVKAHLARLSAQGRAAYVLRRGERTGGLVALKLVDEGGRVGGLQPTWTSRDLTSPALPIIVRAQDEAHLEELLAAGATPSDVSGELGWIACARAPYLAMLAVRDPSRLSRAAQDRELIAIRAAGVSPASAMARSASPRRRSRRATTRRTSTAPPSPCHATSPRRWRRGGSRARRGTAEAPYRPRIVSSRFAMRAARPEPTR